VNKTSNPIRNIHVWSSTFMVYASVMLEKWPSKGIEFFKYMQLEWQLQRVTLKVGLNTTNSNDCARPFPLLLHGGVVDMELWMLCVSTPPSVNTTIGSANSPAYSSGLNSANAQHQNNRGLVCRNFNRGFQCKFGKNCRYSHRCTKCNGIHPMTNCRLKM
jgi:hypothetical protein